MPTTANRIRLRVPSSSPLRRKLNCVGILALAFLAAAGKGEAKDRWSELNIGPFYIDYSGDASIAREDLTQLEQMRWVLGGLLESQNLRSLWPIRIVLTAESPSQTDFALRNGEYLLVCAPSQRLPLGQVAGLLLDANTPRLPAEVESGLRQLFDSLSAHGSKVTWGGPPPHPDLAWARMQLFATRFEYSTSFHIFTTALKSSSTLQAAERNAFGKDVKALEEQAAAVLSAHDWQPVSVSGRPLDPKRDFGEHSLDDAVVGVYLNGDYQGAVNAGGPAAAIGYAGLAAAAKKHRKDPQPLLENAIKAGSRDAHVYVDRADDLPPDEAEPLLKKATQLNPLWSEPFIRQAVLAEKPADKESLLRQAVRLDPRNTEAWIDLAGVQTESGDSTAAQSSWLRAEDSTPTQAEHDRVHQLRESSEGQRLDTAEQARRRDRDAAHLDDQRAQKAEADRIKAAEEKANRALDSSAGAPKPTEVVPWNQTLPERKLTGTLLKLECIGKDSRLSVKDKAGRVIVLFLQGASAAGMTCGTSTPPKRLAVSYAAEPDERWHTAGTVLSIQVQ